MHTHEREQYGWRPIFLRYMHAFVKHDTVNIVLHTGWPFYDHYTIVNKDKNKQMQKLQSPGHMYIHVRICMYNETNDMLVLLIKTVTVTLEVSSRLTPAHRDYRDYLFSHGFMMH